MSTARGAVVKLIATINKSEVNKPQLKNVHHRINLRTRLASGAFGLKIAQLNLENSDVMRLTRGARPLWYVASADFDVVWFSDPCTCGIALAISDISPVVPIDNSMPTLVRTDSVNAS